MDPANSGLQRGFLNQGSDCDVIGGIDDHIVALEEVQGVTGSEVAFMSFNDAPPPLRFEGSPGGSHLWQSLLNVFIGVEDLSVKICGLNPVSVDKGQLSKTAAVEHLGEGGSDTADADQKDRGLCPQVVEHGSFGNPSLAVISLEFIAFHRIPFSRLKIESSPGMVRTLAEPSRKGTKTVPLGVKGCTGARRSLY